MIRRVALTCVAGLLVMCALTYLYLSYSRISDSGKLEVPSKPVIKVIDGSSAESESGFSEVAVPIKNVGRRRLRILRTNASCGCASPVVDPDVLGPGRTAMVRVRFMNVPLGEKEVLVELETDSDAHKFASFRVISIGTKRPPYILQAVGDVTFLQGDPVGHSQPVTVSAVESDTQPRWPKVRVDLPFVQISRLGYEERRYTVPGSILRTYRFAIALSSQPSSSTFAGRFIVTDPWTGKDSTHLPISGAYKPEISVYPGLVILNYGSARFGPSRPALVTVVTRDPGDHPNFACETGDPSLIEFRSVEPSPSPRAHRFEIRTATKPAAGSEWVYHVRSRKGGPEYSRLVIRVAEEGGKNAKP